MAMPPINPLTPGGPRPVSAGMKRVAAKKVVTKKPVADDLLSRVENATKGMRYERGMMGSSAEIAKRNNAPAGKVNEYRTKAQNLGSEIAFQDARIAKLKKK